MLPGKRLPDIVNAFPTAPQGLAALRRRRIRCRPEIRYARVLAFALVSQVGRLRPAGTNSRGPTAQRVDHPHTSVSQGVKVSSILCAPAVNDCALSAGRPRQLELRCWASAEFDARLNFILVSPSRATRPGHGEPGYGGPIV